MIIHTSIQQIIKRNDIWLCDLSGSAGSEQGGLRPVLVLQNNIGNRFSPTVIVAVLSSQITKCKLPTHVFLSAKKYGLDKDSVVFLEQIRTIEKLRLIHKISSLDADTMDKINQATKISLDLIEAV